MPSGHAVPGLYAPGLDGWLAVPLALAAGAAAGLLWALLPAWLKRVAGIDEVVTTLLLNPVAVLLLQGLLNGPWRNPESGFPDSETFGPGYELPTMFGSDRVHIGLLIAVVLIAGTAIVMALTPLGLRLKAAGQAPDAARFSGIAVARLQFSAALVSGAIAGLAGACQVLGVQHQLTGSVAGGYGYTGIVVASLGALTAGGVLLVGLLLGDIAVGAQNASLVLQIPQQMGEIVTAVLLLTVVSFLTLRRYRDRLARRGMNISWVGVLAGMLDDRHAARLRRPRRDPRRARPACSTSASRGRCTPAPSVASSPPRRPDRCGSVSSPRSSSVPRPGR